jgi:hypothetical protein
MSAPIPYWGHRSKDTWKHLTLALDLDPRLHYISYSCDSNLLPRNNDGQRRLLNSFVLENKSYQLLLVHL